jgi:hypothetical protein
MSDIPNQNKSRGRSPFVELPAKFVLTDEGVGYFSNKNIPVRDFMTYDGRRKTGFFWQNFKAPLVQKMVINRMLGQIDIERPELLTKREEIIDLTKLLVYGILYKKFKPALNEILFESEIIDQIRKKNPKKNITSDFRFNTEIVNQFMITNSETIRTLKELLLLDPYAMIDSDTDLGEREKHEKRHIVQRFIEQIEDNTWFLLHFVNKTRGKFEIIDSINRVLLSYVKKTKIADYIGFMLMELAQNAEKAHFERIAKTRKLMGEFDNLDILLKKAEFRQSLIESAVKNSNLMNLNFKFEGDALSLNSRLKLQIQLTNKGLLMEKQKDQLKKKIKTDTRETTLASFYQGADSEKLGAGLGLYYLSYLEDACAEENMKFDARIIADDRREETAVMIILYI